MGYQYEEIPFEKKKRTMDKYIDEFRKNGQSKTFIRFTNDLGMKKEPGYTYIDLNSREYCPRYAEAEYRFMKFLLYDRAKFVPYGAF